MTQPINDLASKDAEIAKLNKEVQRNIDAHTISFEQA